MARASTCCGSCGPLPPRGVSPSSCSPPKATSACSGKWRSWVPRSSPSCSAPASSRPASRPCWTTGPPPRARTPGERLGRDPRGRVRDPVLAALDCRAPQAAPAAGRRPPPAAAGRGAARRAGAARAHPDPHRTVPRRPGSARGTADPAGPSAGRAAGGVHGARARVGGALDLRARLGRAAALAARRLGSRRRSRLPRRRPAGARGGRRVRRAGDGGRQADPQRDGVWLHRPRQAARRRARGAALRREAIAGARGAATAARGALEHRPVCVGRGALSRRGGRLRARAQTGVVSPRGRRHRRLLRCGAPGRGGRRGVGADQAPRRGRRHVSLGRHRLVGRAAAHSQARRARQRGGGKRHPGGRRASLGGLVRQRAPRRDRPGRHGGSAGQRPHPRHADGARRAAEATRAAAVTHALYLLDPEPGPAWEAFLGAEAAGIFALPHLAGFAEPGVPAVTPRRPVTGPAVIGSSTFAPRGLAPALPDGAFRLTCGGITVGWGVGPGATWDRPQPHARTIEVAGTVLHGVYDLVATLEQLLHADLRALLGDTDPIPAGSTVLGDPAAIASHDAVVEPGVVFDVRGGPVVLESGAEVRAGTRLEGPLWVGANAHVLGGSVRVTAIGPRCNVRGEVSNCVFLGYANKAHDGFVGHSVIGRWANLGAGTITSNLKNTYGRVRLDVGGTPLESGLQFLGSLIGDHAKTAIGTLLATGTVIGVGANVFDAVRPPKYVAPFAWGTGVTGGGGTGGTGPGSGRVSRDGFLTVAERVLPRRDVVVDQGTRLMLGRIYDWATR